MTTPYHHAELEVEAVDDGLWKVGRHYVLHRATPFGQYPWLVLTPTGALPKKTREEAFGYAVAQELE